MNYCAIIGDIVKSRQIINRSEAQAKFIHVVEELVNEEFKPYIASKFTVTLGDEFQGLLYDKYAFMSYEIIKYISLKMEPIMLVYGVGIGCMDVQPNYELAIRSDGPAYHKARTMVTKAKEKKPSICYDINSEESELINSLINLIQTYSNKMTSKQREVVNIYKKEKSQRKVAEILNINQATVSRILKNALFYEITYAEKSIIEFLQNKYCFNQK